MLLYNYQKEFLGIDEKTLKLFGFSTLQELQAEVNDFADLFVKQPGYIHNFKHIHWLDFVAYGSDDGSEAKVIINVQNASFTAHLKIERAFFTDNAATAAFIVHLQGLKKLSGTVKNTTSEISLIPQEEPPAVTSATIPKETPVAKPQTTQQTTQQEDLPLSIDIDESLFTHDEDDIIAHAESADIESTAEEKISLETDSYTTDTTQEAPALEEVETENFESSYRYDPSVASKELGLPLDLVEEFIEDFVLQAKEFQPKIYDAIEEGDIESAKSLAHKLKGVAANLRIEDAHEVLSNISATSDLQVIHRNINHFYAIMKKLSAEHGTTEIPAPQEIVSELSPQLLEEHEENTAEKIMLDEEAPLEIDDDLWEDEISLQEETSASTAQHEAKEYSGLATFSKAAAAKEIGLSEYDFEELFIDFCSESREILNKMHSAITARDLQQLHDEAHKFQSMSNNMRLPYFEEELSTILEAKTTDNLDQTVTKLQEKLTQLQEKGV